MVTGDQFLVRPVVSLADVLPPPEDPVCPGGGSAFLAGVPAVGAEVVFVGRSEPDIRMEHCRGHKWTENTMESITYSERLEMPLLRDI